MLLYKNGWVLDHDDPQVSAIPGGALQDREELCKTERSFARPRGASQDREELLQDREELLQDREELLQDREGALDELIRDILKIGL